MNRIIYIFLCFSCLFLNSCSKDDPGSIQEYFKLKNITNAIQTEDGMYFIKTVEGNQSKKPKINSDVRVKYVGTLLNGKQFDANELEFNLSRVIPGWTRGIPLFGEGGKGKLFIPANMGYGDVEKTNIPANSDLVFEIELIKVIN